MSSRAERGIRAGSALAAAAAFLAGLLCAFVLAEVHRPPAIFPKYLEAAALPAHHLGERLGDYSPLYLSFVRALAPNGHAAVLAAQGVLHALTAAAVAAAVASLAGSGWGLGAGLAAAAYRPLLVHAGLHEPEAAIAFCLAIAVLAGVLARRNSGEGLRWAWPLVAGLGLGAAALLRPQHLLLVPVWAVWIGARRRSFLPAFFVLLAALAVVVPFSLARWRATGSLSVMDPGAVFYEGNGPGATGLRSHAPAAVLAAERGHPRETDYRHVAYRRIASAALGRPVAPAESNRYWTRLAREAMAAWPVRAAGRFARKVLFALMPYEAHDLVPAEHLDRRVRARLPWGFALLAVALPWSLLPRRDRLADLAGPLAVAALALAVQVVFYASARQRLPLALALLVAAPVLLADLLRGRLRAGVRRSVALALGLVVAGALAAASGRWAVLDQIEWDETLGRPPAGLGGRFVALQEGQAGRSVWREDALLFRAALGRFRSGDLGSALPAFAVLAEGGRDFTIDEEPVGVPAYWLARCHLALGDRPRARAALAAALAVRPDDPRLLALAARLNGGRARVPGVDPVTARMIR